jgi:hypothetical protein
MKIIFDFIIIGHAFVGAIAIFSGMLALFFRKGGTKHQNWGVTFYWSVLLTAGSAIVISLIPDHQSPFLFMVAIFSSYFALTGRKALLWRRKPAITFTDKLYTSLILLCGLGLVCISLFINKEINILWLSFGAASIYFGTRDYLNFKNEARRQNFWLRVHIGRMVGAFIAVCSAFLVVNSILPSMLNWYLPALIGVPYILYWTSKVKRSKRWTSGKYRIVIPKKSI